MPIITLVTVVSNVCDGTGVVGIIVLAICSVLPEDTVLKHTYIHQCMNL